MKGVALGQIDVADGVIQLIEIVLVVVRRGHAPQTIDHALGVAGSHHLRLGDAGIELQFVGWVQAHHVAEGFVSVLAVAQLRMELSHQKPLAGFLLATGLMLDDLAQIGDGLFVAFAADVVVGIGIVPVLDGTIVHRVATLLRYHILCIVEPA